MLEERERTSEAPDRGRLLIPKSRGFRIPRAGDISTGTWKLMSYRYVSFWKLEDSRNVFKIPKEKEIQILNPSE